MTVATIEFKSESLHRSVSYMAIIPETGEGPYPVVIQLHGYSDSYTAWVQQTNIVRYAAEYPMIIVFPDGGTSFYLNLPDASLKPSTHPVGNQRYEDYLIHDLRQHVSRTLPVRAGRWGIGGLSMGGYGSMRLGCTYPDLFASIWAHSGVYLPAQALNGYFPDPEAANVYLAAERLASSSRNVTISFDCGTEDELLDQNRMLHAHLEKLGLTHQYFEHPGAHNWEYWDVHVREALAQHQRVFEQENAEVK